MILAAFAALLAVAPVHAMDTDTDAPAELPRELDGDGDGSPDDEDCAPRDNTVYPGSEEYNDGKDNDCDGDQPPLYGCGQTSYAGLFLAPFALFRRRRGAP